MSRPNLIIAPFFLLASLNLQAEESLKTAPSEVPLPSPSAALSSIPPENAEGSLLPSAKGAELMGQALLAAIVAGDSSDAESIFFPRAAFLQLKNIPHADRYYNQLIKWFQADIIREHQRTKKLAVLEFDRVELGRCRWKKSGSEYNKIPYWSCSRSKLMAKSAGAKVEFTIVSMINWGELWYPTHLGPIPK